LVTGLSELLSVYAGQEPCVIEQEEIITVIINSKILVVDF